MTLEQFLKDNTEYFTPIKVSRDYADCLQIHTGRTVRVTINRFGNVEWAPVEVGDE